MKGGNMSELLTNEEKISVVNQHLKNLEYNKYNVELSLMEENSTTQINDDIILSLNEQLVSINAKINILQQEITALTE